MRLERSRRSSWSGIGGREIGAVGEIWVEQSEVKEGSERSR
jgi:hypothetical protein